MVMRKMANLLQRRQRSLRGLSSLGTIRDVSDDRIHPIQYFREFPMFRDGRNNMMKTFPMTKNPLLPTNTGVASGRSFPKLVAGYHARGLCLGKALSLDNIAVLRKSHSFVLLHVDESSLPPLSEDGRVADLNSCGGILDFCVKKSLRDTYGYPHCFKDLLEKLKSANPPYKRIMWHPCFFSSLSAFWFRVMIDFRLLKEFESMSLVYRQRVKYLLVNMPHLHGKGQVDGLVSIIKRDKVVNSWLRSERLTREQCADENYMPSWSELDTGRMVVIVNRDGLIHIFETECNRFRSVKRYMNLENAIDMMRLEFDEFECKTIDLLEDQLLYPDIGIPELFGETVSTWSIIFQQKEIYPVPRASMPNFSSEDGECEGRG